MNDEGIKIFVYGLLKGYMPNKPALLKGYKKVMQGHWNIVEGTKDDNTKGQLMIINQELLDRFDQFEGYGYYYTRIKVDVTLLNGEIIKDVWVYKQIES